MANEGKVTIKSVVVAGANAGHDVETIAKTIVSTFPGSKAAENPTHYAKYYLNQMGKTAEVISTRTKAGSWLQREQQKPKVALPDFKAVIGYAEYGQEGTKHYTKIPLYRSHLRTCHLAREQMTQRQVIIAYEQIADANVPPGASMKETREVVVGDIQNRWYQTAGVALPPRVEQSQAQRLEETKMAKAKKDTTEKAAKEPRITVKSIVTNGLLAGHSDEQIAESIVEQCPDTAAAKAPNTHIAYYRSMLVKAGELEKQPRKSRAAAEEKPAKAKAKAKKAPAKKSGKAKK